MTLITDRTTVKAAPSAPAAPLSDAEQDTLVKLAAAADEKAQVPTADSTAGDGRGWTTLPEKLSDRARAAASAASERASQVFGD